MEAIDDSLYTSCMEVLGKARDHITFQRLTEKLQQEPILAMENNHVAFYDFRERGIELIYSRSNACFSGAVFFVDTPSVRQGNMQQYSGMFLNGVMPDDSMSEVERKIDMDSSRFQLPSEFSLEYDLPDHKLTFYFDGPGEQMKLVLVKGKRALTQNKT